MTIIIFGPPGCGKGTQSALISEKYKLKHLSTGDMLRDEMANKTELGLLAANYVNSGKLVPDNLIIDMLMNEIQSTNDQQNGILLDGFPRTFTQAEALEFNLASRNKQTNVLIELNVDYEELTSRILLRGLETGRKDDSAETIKKRMEVYSEKTIPVRNYYQELNKYVSLHGTGEINEIFAEICKIIDKEIEKSANV